MLHLRTAKWLAVTLLLLAAAAAAITLTDVGSGPVSAASPPAPDAAGDYIVLSWNDLGMHCYNPRFQDLAVLPPYNTLWAQVIKIGDPPQIITTGITVTFFFTDNTYSAGKTDFWATSAYRPEQNAQWLFGLSSPLPDNVGLKGFGLAGTMDAHSDHFEAVGIPLTEYSDSAPAVRYPYQVATIVVQDATTGVELARLNPVAPVSTEMHCEYCHYDNGPGNEDIATGVVEQNILTAHDQENMEDYPPSHAGPLMDQRPVLCAWCHSSNALEAPGVPEVPSFSNAMHEQHAEEIPSTLEGCYYCHPGPQTRCLRGVMATNFGLVCRDCHGNLEKLSQNPDPWLLEPRCDNPDCHGSGFAQDQPLYRNSKEHGGVYCEGCHDSTHAIAPSREPNDAIKFIQLQGYDAPLNKCTVCHATQPEEPGPHGLTATLDYSLSFTPDRFGSGDPGEQVTCTHALRNNGTISDTYQVTWSSSRGWATVTETTSLQMALPPLTLMPNEVAMITVTVTIPNTDTVRGLVDVTVVTATSMSDPTVMGRVVDTTLVARMRIYLPTILRNELTQ
jgi:hypothetical protein